MNKELLDFFAKIGLADFDPKNYVDPGSPLKKGEKELGVMNELEKSCYSFLEKKQEEHEEIHEKIARKMVNGDGNSPETKQLLTDHCRIKNTVDSVRTLMWASIYNRFELTSDSTGVAVRKDFKIVACFEKREESPFQGFNIIEIGVIKM